MPTASIIIPTHNRRERLLASLDHLANQTYPLHDMEVIVVPDGCTDGTGEALCSYPAPFRLIVAEQANEGPAAARNRGAAASSGRLLIFMDDDIHVSPGFVQAHVQAHGEHPDRVVIGYLPPHLEHQHGYFRLALWRWWHDMYSRMRRPGHRFAYTDLLSGNFSLPASVFCYVEGFNPALRCHEDYELGVRLLKAGMAFHFAPDALGRHVEQTDISRALARKYAEGKADVQLGRLHPELRPSLPLAHMQSHMRAASRALQGLARRWPAAGDMLARQALEAMPPLERLGQWRLWRRALDGLLAYWYWRGIVDDLRTRDELAAFLNEAAPDEATEVEIDLSDGLIAAERCLDQVRPHAARLSYGQHAVGLIPAVPGAERLRSSHLRPWLALVFGWPLLEALARSGHLDLPISNDELSALGGTDRLRLEPLDEPLNVETSPV